MRRNCNLELRLVPPSPFIFSDHHHGQENTREEQNRVGGESKEQQLTIFYDGKVSVCDVTELQARTIIKLASDEIEEKWRRTPGSATSSEQYSPLVSPAVGNQTGLSMKRSLQRFLQKRKNRIQATSPYTTRESVYIHGFSHGQKSVGNFPTDYPRNRVKFI